MTGDLTDRLISHREKHDPKSFTAKYNLWKLVYYELTHSIEEAIDREKYIKGKAGSGKLT